LTHTVRTERTFEHYVSGVDLP